MRDNVMVLLWGASLAMVAAWSLPAAAQDAELTAEADRAWRPGFGARVGGYGFRQATAEGETSWEDCRMDGVGVFATVDVTRLVFSEVSLDMYHATADVVNDGMDRLSMHALGSMGVRMFPDFYVTPYVQLGGGAEWTRVDMVADGATVDGWYPVGFMGIGGEINVTDHLKLGANIRAFIMKHPDHGHGGDGEVHAQGLEHTLHGLEATSGASTSGVPMSFETAGQAQFFLRYAL
ncbi:MAG: hypothetical protein CMH57_00325 [Myxococcales bacterium]|nr:hypothetical protein [Myxococcales bacterium]